MPTGFVLKINRMINKAESFHALRSYRLS
jgi:hypothetical protein